MPVTTPPSGTLLRLPIDKLLLDWNNPRLPPELRKSRSSQRVLARLIEKEYNALKIAESIARHEYFLSEPLIAVQEGDQYRVIEGNRRLTALLGLTDEDLRAEFAKENRAWNRIDTSNAPTEVPVLVVKDKSAVAPLLGFRHISGIEPWEPYAQAVFVSELVDGGQALDEVADVVGRSTTEVRSMYRDYDILRFATDRKIDASGARDSFGVFTAAMGRPAIRAYIGASAPRDVDPQIEPLPESRTQHLAQLLSLLFGDSKGQERVIHDSRQIGQLVRVFSDPDGEAVSVLLETRDLDDALAALDAPEDRLLRGLERAARQIERASRDWQGALPESAVEIVHRLNSATDALRKRLS
jgi:hypothetical protein